MRNNGILCRVFWENICFSAGKITGINQLKWKIQESPLSANLSLLQKIQNTKCKVFLKRIHFIPTKRRMLPFFLLSLTRSNSISSLWRVCVRPHGCHAASSTNRRYWHQHTNQGSQVTPTQTCPRVTPQKTRRDASQWWVYRPSSRGETCWGVEVTPAGREEGTRCVSWCDGLSIVILLTYCRHSGQCCLWGVCTGACRSVGYEVW